MNIRADASITEDGSRMVVSNLTGFDMYSLPAVQSLGSFSHALGHIHAIPVQFVHNGKAIVCGSAVGEVEIRDAETLEKYCALPAQRKCHATPIPC